ncbi:hypothetical protein Nmel_013507 [Mimus melanotis]
MVSFIP